MPPEPIFSTRRSDIVVEDVSDELLIYDRRADVAHCLSDVAALVWRTCEGGATLGEIAEQISARGLTGSKVDAAELASTAVAELAEQGLLETSGAGAAVGLISRRRALRRMAGIGAAAVSAPLIVSAGVPTAAFAAASCASYLGACHTSYNSGTTVPVCCSTAAHCRPVNSSTNPKQCCVSDVAVPLGAGAHCTRNSDCCSYACSANTCQ